MFTRLSVSLAFVVFSSPLALAAPKIDNRPAKSDEWGYRPAEGSKPPLNPPSLCWVHESDAVTYSVEWSTDKSFAKPTTVGNIPWPTYTHNATLPPGTYYWRYRFVDKKGEKSNFSQARSFIVAPDARAFPMPTRAEQLQRVPQKHPRLFMRPEDLPRLRQLAKGDEAERFNKLRAEADKIIKAGPTPEPKELGSARDKENDALVKNWWPNREQTEKACKEAEAIAFVYLISGEKKYGEAARQWIMHLAAWDPDGPTNFKLNCEAGKPMLFRPARAYDWAYDTLSAADRQKFQAVMQRRIKDCWESGEARRGVGHLNQPYNSHGNRVWHKMGETGIALLGEVPEAETWVDYAVNKFYACYPVWSDDDGGWHEGVSYWAGYNAKAVWWLHVSQVALGINGYQKPYYSQVADYAMYVCPPGSPNMGFGDLSYRPVGSGWGGWLEYHLRVGGSQGRLPSPGSGPFFGQSMPQSPNDVVRKHGPDPLMRDSAVTHAPYWRWWIEQWKMKGEGGWLGFLYAANLPKLPDAKAPTDLPPSKVFHGIGVASMHTDLTDSSRDVHFLMKSSPFGSQSHGHNPQNSFQLNVFGEQLLTTCVYRDLHGSKFHYNWAHSTVAHNAVLVNGEGQVKHSVASQGKIVGELFAKDYDYIAGDATAAYGGKLKRAVRHVAFVKGIGSRAAQPTLTPNPYVARFWPEIAILIYDDLEAVEPSTYQFMLHGLSAFKVDEAQAELVQEQKKAGCIVRYLAAAPQKLKLKQWDGFDPLPKKDFPNQWHVEASTGFPLPLAGEGLGVRVGGEPTKSTTCQMLTLIVPYEAGHKPDLTTARVETDSAIGAKLTINGRPFSIAFPKPAAPAPTWQSKRFTGPVVVE